MGNIFAPRRSVSYQTIDGGINAGAAGTVWRGGSNSETPMDSDSLWDSIQEDIGKLSPAEVAKIKAIMAKYAAGSSGSTQSAGVTSFDSVNSSLAQVRKNTSEIAGMNKANKEFWDKRI